MVEARIVERRKTAIARKRLCKHATTPEQSLGNNIGTVGSGVFYAIRAEAI
jgi:hypothetical protein